jgi:hypothetical protein
MFWDMHFRYAEKLPANSIPVIAFGLPIRSSPSQTLSSGFVWLDTLFFNYFIFYFIFSLKELENSVTSNTTSLHIVLGAQTCFPLAIFLSLNSYPGLLHYSHSLPPFCWRGYICPCLFYRNYGVIFNSLSKCNC